MENGRKNYPSKISLILRIVVSAYLLYLAWGLRGAPASHTGTQKLFFIAAIAVFAIVGAVLGGFSLRAYIKGEYDQPGGESDSDE